MVFHCVCVCVCLQNTTRGTLTKSGPKHRHRDSLGTNWKFSATPASEFRSATLSLYITLARLYLNGDRLQSAVNVLEMLRKTELPRNRVAVVHLLLATVISLASPSSRPRFSFSIHPCVLHRPT